MSDFNNEQAIKALVQEHENKVLASEHLIIDVRHNAGMTDLAYLPLLAFILDQSPKVIVIGRNTMGVLDYSNVAYLDLNEHFTLMYPTTRMNYLDSGPGIDNIGIAPDIYVKWTPEQLVKDLDLQEVFEQIADKQ